MFELVKSVRFADVAPKMRQIVHAPATRKWTIRLLIGIVIFGLLGLFAAPPLIRSVAQRELAKALARPVSIARVSLNPFTLRLEVDGIHIGEPAGSDEFIGLDRLMVRASWGPLFRLKPVVNEVLLDAPHVHIVRTAPQQFNFSDLIEKYSKPGPPSTGGKPTLFSISNIRIEGGLVAFNDEVLKERHSIEQLRIGIPFIANLPSKIDIFVQPLLEAKIDGSFLSVTGKAKPFSASRESNVELKLDKLDLLQLQSYAPATLPVRLTKGRLSSDLNVQFAIAGDQPHVGVSGTVDLDDLGATDRAGAPLLDAKTIHVAATSVEPLLGVFHLAEIRIDSPVLALSRDADGKLNLAKLAPPPGKQPPVEAHASARKPSTPQSSVPQAEAAPLDFAVQKLALNDGAVRFQDHLAGGTVKLDLHKLAVVVSDFGTLASTPATYTVTANLEQGGELSVDGALTFAEHKVETKLGIERLALPPFQPYLAPVLNAQLNKGTLGAHVAFKAGWADPFSLEVEPGELVLDGLRVVSGRAGQPAIELGRATAHIKAVDLSARRAELASVEIENLAVNAERAADGTIDLTKLVKTGPAKKPPARVAVTTPAESPWHYSIGTVSLSKSAIGFNDHANAAPVALRVSALELKVGDLSEDLGKPWKLDLAGKLQSKGTFAVHGTVGISPLKLALHVNGNQLDVATFEPYLGGRLNASIASALLSLNGDASVATNADHSLKVLYKGDAGLASVRMLDKTTSDLFAGWRLLSLTQIKAAYDGRAPDVEIGKIALSNFFAKIFLDSTGQLNLSRFVAKQDAPRQSLTRADQTSAAPVVATPETAAGPAVPPANLRFDAIVLDGGNVDYTDNFIKPNFSANLTAIGGKIGAFGTQSTQPAAVDLGAKLNSDGPVAISGTINPLAQPPALDLTATARDIELTRFAAYSEKYTGYPIVKGKLLVDLHYLLDKNQLTANNHVFIDQLTFGDHVDSPTATNLPVRLAISLLKNSRGEIDINVPVSGSLSDPQFSVGSLIWHAFTNLIEKAVTSPFSLLASAFGGSDELGSVEFAAGSDKLSEADEAKLDTLNKALADRPGIKLDLLGRSDPATDRPALKEKFVERQIKLQKIKGLVGKGESVDIDSVSIAPEEYDKYLTRAYKAADFKKPSNFIGLSKALPADEAKKLLLDNTEITDADLLALAQGRANAVRDWFTDKIDASRIYVVAPALKTADSKEGGTTTGVEFTLK